MNLFIEFTDKFKDHDPMLIEAIQRGYYILHESFSESADEVLDIFEYMTSINPDIIENSGSKALVYIRILSLVTSLLRLI